jgi:hypothetical protein
MFFWARESAEVNDLCGIVFEFCMRRTLATASLVQLDDVVHLGVEVTPIKTSTGNYLGHKPKRLTRHKETFIWIRLGQYIITHFPNYHSSLLLDIRATVQTVISQSRCATLGCLCTICSSWYLCRYGTHFISGGNYFKGGRKLLQGTHATIQEGCRH